MNCREHHILQKHLYQIYKKKRQAVKRNCSHTPFCDCHRWKINRTKYCHELYQIADSCLHPVHDDLAGIQTKCHNQKIHHVKARVCCLTISKCPGKIRKYCRHNRQHENMYQVLPAARKCIGELFFNKPLQ